MVAITIVVAETHIRTSGLHTAILAGMLIRLRIKRPELFRFTDTEAEENEASTEEQKSE